MIIDIPDKEDFLQAGLSMLNLAWDAVVSLYINLEYSELNDQDADVSTTEAYWKAAQHPISVALALAQQGIELLLKGRIVEVSPFLLLTGPRDWPSGCSDKDTPFADFRTIEAHELIRIHDAVVSERLSDSFKSQFENIRRLRNTVFHGVDKRVRPAAEDVFRVVLEAVHRLYEPRSWVRLRRDYLESTPSSIAYSGPDSELILITEALQAVRILKPSETKKYFGFHKNRRRYICYTCALNCSDASLEPKIAVLDPNTPDSATLYCFVCDKHYAVVREKCTHAGCPGNVIDAGDGICLSCYKGVDIE
jgi:hypothetical protein